MLQYWTVGPRSPSIAIFKYTSNSPICCWKIGLVLRNCSCVPQSWGTLERRSLRASFIPWQEQGYHGFGQFDYNICLGWNSSVILQLVCQTLSTAIWRHVHLWMCNNNTVECQLQMEVSEHDKKLIEPRCIQCLDWVCLVSCSKVISNNPIFLMSFNVLIQAPFHWFTDDIISGGRGRYWIRLPYIHVHLKLLSRGTFNMCSGPILP